jgi:hypothetical protein
MQESAMRALTNVVKRGGAGTSESPEIISFLAFNEGSPIHAGLKSMLKSLQGESFLLVSLQDLPASGLTHNLVFVHVHSSKPVGSKEDVTKGQTQQGRDFAMGVVEGSLQLNAGLCSVFNRGEYSEPLQGITVDPTFVLLSLNTSLPEWWLHTSVGGTAPIKSPKVRLHHSME